MNYYPQRDSHIRNKINVELHLSNYAIKRELDHAAVVEKSDLPANDLKTKVDDSDLCRLKHISVDMKILSDLLNNEFVKNTKFNTLKKKANNLG